MADDGLRPIIVKRIKKSAHAPHGGAWKIAYADFVTAMMAFFLLMWLLGSTSKGDLQGIAEYFRTPLRIAMFGGEGSGASSTVLPGGGKDLSKAQGQLQTTGKSSSAESRKAALRAQEQQERNRLQEVKARLEQAIDSNPTLKQYKNQLLLDITSEGLRIQIVDEKNRPRVSLASAQVQPYTRTILREIGKVLNDVPNKISLSGHTDATAYSSGEKSYSNWELSSDRANASRRELVAGGMDEAKVMRVVGLASAVLLDKEDPFNPVNRRISIVVMNKKTEKSVEKEDSAASSTSSGMNLKDEIDEWDTDGGDE
jgi:chemotaxis protein MotB